jgi:hypothetical protein
MPQVARKFVLSPLSVLFFVSILAVGEFAAGTTPYFVAMMVIAVFSACVTYNVLGGLGTISGIAFTYFALSTLVVSQVVKVILFEPADQNLDVPQLTITVYAVFYFWLMLGTIAFARIRLPLLKPREPDTPAQTRYLYLISLVGGLAGSIVLLTLDLAGGAEQTTLAHGFARAFAYLLPFSLVVAVDERIRITNGRHMFGWKALWPSLAMVFLGFLRVQRGPSMQPLVIVLLTCYVRDFKFGKKHLAAAGAIAAAVFLFISPFYLWARAWKGEATIKEQATVLLNVLESAPAQWASIKNQVGESALEGEGSVNYFATPGAVTLNRFALIGPDSTLVNACAGGFHYGFTALKLDILGQIPRFLYRDKPTIGSAEYLGHLDGQESDVFQTTYSTITPISDSYGAFSWAGTVIFPFLAMPLMFVIYESMFDMRRPWGTVAVVMFALTEGGMGDILGNAIKNPIYILIISWSAAWLITMIPSVGDRSATLTRFGSEAVSTGALKD